MPAAKSGTARSSATYCLDASVVVRRFSPDHPGVRDLWSEFIRTNARLVAPRLLRYEVTNAFHQMSRAGVITQATAQRHLAHALSLPIEIHDDADLHLDAARIATTHGLPATYDAHYLALAEGLGVDLFTADQKLAKAIGDQLPWVRLVA